MPSLRWIGERASRYGSVVPKGLGRLPPNAAERNRSRTARSAAGEPATLTRALGFLGTPEPGTLVGSPVSWEDDRWSRGAYAVFTPAFDPRDRRLLARVHGRVAFAGEHTSERWRGFMNGAVESGQRAAAELLALEAVAVSLT